MNHSKNILLLGTGPVSIQLAVLLKKYLGCCVGIAGRASVRSEPFFAALQQNNRLVCVDVQNEKKHRHMRGKCFIDHVFQGYKTITGTWEMLILCVTADAYLEVLKQIDPKIIKQTRCVVLISPTFGSNSLVSHYLKELQHTDAEIISFSTYLGDTRWSSGEPSNHVITAGVKKKLYIGSNDTCSHHVATFCQLYKQIGIDLDVMGSPLEAETRNISLYVHPPLFMNECSLDVVFQKDNTKKYVYKMFPEGPITQYVIRDMLAIWKEMTAIMEKLNIKVINLLQFMTDDNYPVRLESISREDIERFNQLEQIHQEYLLYIRYTSLLIDPFSEPDQDGRYFDFSAVPIPQIFVNREGKWDIPRMPKEDYYRTKIIQGIGETMGIRCPTIDKCLTTYECKLKEAAETRKHERLSDAFVVQSFEQEWKMIDHEIRKRTS